MGSPLPRTSSVSTRLRRILCLLGLLLFSMMLILPVAGMEDLDGMKVDYGANARLSVQGTPNFCSGTLRCGGCRVIRNAEFRTPFDGAYLGRVFRSFAVPVCLGAAGRRVSLARCADDPGSPVGTALALGGPPQDGGYGGVCGCGISPRRVLALRDGGGVRSAGRDCLRLNPLSRKKCHHIHT